VPEKSLYQTSSILTEESFTTFYHDHYAFFCFFANRFVNNMQEAEDIVGDVAFRVWEKRDELRNDTALKTYFYTSLRNACLNRIGKEKTIAKRESRYVNSIQSEQPSVLENIIRTETLRELETAIHSLPAQCRRVFIHLFVEGKTLSETAEEMQLSLSTIKNQRQRGIQLLRKRLTPTALVFCIAALCFFGD
jgi:RNA polymerase sigma-70 factor (family 1)